MVLKKHCMACMQSIRPGAKPFKKFRSKFTLFWQCLGNLHNYETF